MDMRDQIRDVLQTMEVYNRVAEMLPSYICSAENYEYESTTVLDGIPIEQFSFYISKVEEILEMILNGDGTIKEYNDRIMLWKIE